MTGRTKTLSESIIELREEFEKIKKSRFEIRQLELTVTEMMFDRGIITKAEHDLDLLQLNGRAPSKGSALLPPLT